MKLRLTVTGAAQFRRKLELMREALRRDVPSVLKQEARALAVELGRATAPFGFDEGKADKYRKRIKSDIGRVYATKRSDFGLVSLLLQRNPALGRAYLRAKREGKEDQMKRYLRMAGLQVEKLNESTLKQARSGKHGSVPKERKPDVLIQENQFQALVKRQQALVGFAQAGWYVAAKSLGGRVRRNLVLEDGSRRTEEIFPDHVRKLARKYPGIGGARMVFGDLSSITIFTSVRHARNALEDRNYQAAVSEAREKFERALAKSLAEINKRYLRVA